MVRGMIKEIRKILRDFWCEDIDRRVLAKATEEIMVLVEKDKLEDTESYQLERAGGKFSGIVLENILSFIRITHAELRAREDTKKVDVKR